MKTCELCFKLFPATIKIEGKSRNLTNRRYCLECSPFGSHNTKRLSNYENPPVDAKKVCINCGKKNVTNRDDYKYCSNSCRVSQKRKYYKRLGVEYKGGCCVICGYDRCVRALHFHHLDPSEKDFSIAAKGYTRSWEKMKNELDKCVLLCSNCHSEAHENMIELDLTILSSFPNK
jgi:hypothetical protein